jgi:hypothetical protein
MTENSTARPTVLHHLAQFDFGGAEKHMVHIWSQADHHRYVVRPEDFDGSLRSSAGG